MQWNLNCRNTLRDKWTNRLLEPKRRFHCWLESCDISSWRHHLQRIRDGEWKAVPCRALQCRELNYNVSPLIQWRICYWRYWTLYPQAYNKDVNWLVLYGVPQWFYSDISVFSFSTCPRLSFAFTTRNACNVFYDIHSELYHQCHTKHICPAFSSEVFAVFCTWLFRGLLLRNWSFSQRCDRKFWSSEMWSYCVG